MTNPNPPKYARNRLGEITKTRPQNWALAFHRYAPWRLQSNGKEKAEYNPEDFVGRPVPEVYRQAYTAWREAMDSLVVEASTVGPLIYGVGDKAVHETGMTFQWTYGVPALRGSAIKGAMRRTARRLLGLEDLVGDDVKPDADEKILIERAPSDEMKEALRIWNALFGSTQGRAALTIHDAWLIPEGAGEKPFKADVVTVHHRNYYQDPGEGETQPPSDMDNPNPIPFLSLRPGIRFAFAFEIDPDWRDVAKTLLCRALIEDGLGAKTNAGYGRFHVPGFALEEAASPPPPSVLPVATNTARCSQAGIGDAAKWKVDRTPVTIKNLPPSQPFELGDTVPVAPSGRQWTFATPPEKP